MSEKSEIEKLREIIFGAQAKETYEKFSELDGALKQSREEQINLLQNQNATLTSIIEGLDTKLDQVSTFLSDRLDKVVVELNQKIDDAVADSNKKLKALTKDSQANDKEIKAELAAITDSLKTQKVSRRQMTDILVELGTRLQGDEFEE